MSNRRCHVAKPDAKMLVPLAPEDFAELLKKRVFTNGADRDFVSDLYKKTINEALSQTTELHTSSSRSGATRRLPSS